MNDSLGGIQIQVRVDGIAAINQVIANLTAAGQNLRPVMRDIGARILASTHQNFINQHDPNGLPWTPLSEARIQERLRKMFGANDRRKDGTLTRKASENAKEYRNSMKILIDTGGLLRSIHYQADNTSVAIGTNKNYAAQLQEGVGMPARPFLGINARDRVYIMESLTNFMRNAAQRSAGHP